MVMCLGIPEFFPRRDMKSGESKRQGSGEDTMRRGLTEAKVINKFNLGGAQRELCLCTKHDS